MTSKVNDKEALQKRLQDIPPVVVDGLLSRFTETVRNTSEYVQTLHYKCTAILKKFEHRFRSTSQTETILLTHMFALCLRIDDYAADIATLAHDLSMASSKSVNLSDSHLHGADSLFFRVEMLFKSLGWWFHFIYTNHI